jgi:NAD(P)-dependent dehydrogenase (short-subunit alcohol dehydrogenase family)
MAHATDARVALVTGGTAGLGLALTAALAARGWRVVTDGRGAPPPLPGRASFLRGDVADPGHRADLATAVRREGRLDLLVHNASTLGRLPMRTLAEVDGADLDDAWAVNVRSAHDLNRLLVPLLRESGGTLVSLSSDAAVDHHPTWGPYGATKAALDHLTLTWGVESDVRAYAVDPGDMRTRMHQDAFPGEDISDRPLPESVVPHLLALLDRRPASGRVRAAEVAA